MLRCVGVSATDNITPQTNHQVGPARPAKPQPQHSIISSCTHTPTKKTFHRTDRAHVATSSALSPAVLRRHIRQASSAWKPLVYLLQVRRAFIPLRCASKVEVFSFLFAGECKFVPLRGVPPRRPPLTHSPHTESCGDGSPRRDIAGQDERQDPSRQLRRQGPEL